MSNAADLSKRRASKAFQAYSACKTAQKIWRARTNTNSLAALPPSALAAHKPRPLRETIPDS